VKGKLIAFGRKYGVMAFVLALAVLTSTDAFAQAATPPSGMDYAALITSAKAEITPALGIAAPALFGLAALFAVIAWAWRRTQGAVR
jgi:hypothetical protein